METLLLDAKKEGAVETAAEIIKKGGLVAIPTETVYGLAANAFDPVACANIFKAKGRPGDNPLIVHICSMDMISDVVEEVPEKAKILAEKFWPGPLTMIMKKSDKIPLVTSANLPTVAVRFPSHPVAQKIIEKSGLPLAAPSANLSGSPSPTAFEHCVHDLMGRVDAIIDGGPCSVGVESTIISFAEETPVLLRPGYVTLEQLREAIGEVSLSKAVLEKLGAGEKVLSPGMKYKHYAPNAAVILVDADVDSFVNYVNGNAGERDAVFTSKKDSGKFNCTLLVTGETGSPAELSHSLYSLLRRADELSLEKVYIKAPPKSGEYLALYNRLIRAAAGKITKP